MSRRFYMVFGFTIGFAAAALVFMAILVTVPPPVADAPLEFVLDTYDPMVGCPGDEQHYEVGMLIKEPGVVYGAIAVLRADDHATVIEARRNEIAQALGDAHSANIVGDTAQFRALGDTITTIIPTSYFATETAVLFYDTDASITLPDLPPGRYNRVLAAGLLGVPAKEAIRTQAFEIMEGCQ